MGNPEMKISYRTCELLHAALIGRRARTVQPAWVIIEKTDFAQTFDFNDFDHAFSISDVDLTGSWDQLTVAEPRMLHDVVKAALKLKHEPHPLTLTVKEKKTPKQHASVEAAGTHLSVSAIVGGRSLLIDGEWNGVIADVVVPPPAPAEWQLYLDADEVTRFTHEVQQVAKCASADDTLPVLTALHLQMRENRLELATTDRYRLAQANGTAPVSDNASDIDGWSAMPPAKTFSSTMKALEKIGVGPMHLAADQDYWLWVRPHVRGAASARIADRVIVGEFPKYRSLWPAEVMTTVTVDRKRLLSVAKAAAATARATARTGKKSAAVPIRLQFTETGYLASLFQDGELAFEEVVLSEQSAYSLDGEGLSVGLNPGFLADILGITDGDVVTIGLVSPTKPIVITGDSSLRCLLMPIRLTELS